MRVKKIELKDGKIEKKNVKEFTQVKSNGSYRTLGLQDELVEMLKEHKEAQKKLAKKNNKEFKETDWVFTTNTYNAYVSDYIWDKVKKVMYAIKIKDYDKLSTHNLRHTFCTLGLRDGTNIEDMKNVMGHADVATTMIYMHAQKEKVIEDSKKIANNFAKYL